MGGNGKPPRRAKCAFLAFNAAKSAEEFETRKERLLRLLREEPGAQAAFDRMAAEFYAQAQEAR